MIMDTMAGHRTNTFGRDMTANARQDPCHPRRTFFNATRNARVQNKTVTTWLKGPTVPVMESHQKTVPNSKSTVNQIAPVWDNFIQPNWIRRLRMRYTITADKAESISGEIVFMLKALTPQIATKGIISMIGKGGFD